MAEEEIVGTFNLSLYLNWFKELHTPLEYIHHVQLVRNEINYWRYFLKV